MKTVMLTILAATLVAQHQHPASKPVKPATLTAGLGKHHHPISTTSPLAQKFFDQGLVLVYSFNHDEAVRSFTRAAELDPKAAMPNWGVALALGPNINSDVDPAREKAAYDALQKALARRAAAPPVERAYIDALARRYSDDPKADLKKLAVDYKNAMGELMRAYPDDLDAATLYAEALMDLNPWRLWTSDGHPAEGTEDIVSVLEGVLKRDPQHVGANHYYIHAVEASPHPERALASAQRLETLVPGAGHLVHMPGHIYVRTGDFEAAARTNVVAAEVDRNYIRASQSQGMYPLMYYSHNLHFIAYARTEQGLLDEARTAADQLAANVAPAAKEMPMAEPFLGIRYFVLLRFGRWDDMLRAPAPADNAIIVSTLWHYARGVALAGKSDRNGAAAEQAKFEEFRKKVPAETPFGNNTSANVLALAAATLDARLASDADAVERWRAAVRAYDLLSYDEPPAWYYPVRESLGAALYRAGRYAEAETVFREALDANPRGARLLFGLRESLKSQKKDSSLPFVERELQAAWKGAPLQIYRDDIR